MPIVVTITRSAWDAAVDAGLPPPERNEVVALMWLCSSRVAQGAGCHRSRNCDYGGGVLLPLRMFHRNAVGCSTWKRGVDKVHQYLLELIRAHVWLDVTVQMPPHAEGREQLACGVVATAHSAQVVENPTARDAIAAGTFIACAA